MTHHCYILQNGINKKTYNGYTVNPTRRLRQHNGELKGGAKATSSTNSWEYIAIVSGFPDEINALQCEWRIRHPNNKRKRPQKYCRPEGRIKGLNEVLKLEKWTSNSTVNNLTLDLKVKVLAQYSHLLADLPENVIVEVVEVVDHFD